MIGIDLFAGLGGWTTGAEMAGVKIAWAANHWPLAVEMHAANHPNVIHACQDLRQANWYDVPAHDILLASPECKGHTPARGKEKPQHDDSRSTAWAVVDACEAHLPEFGLIENVPEFLQWKLYPAWQQALNLLGYSLAPHVLDAADFGVPQNRRRVYIVLTKSRAPLYLNFKNKPHAPVNNIINWHGHTWNKIDTPRRSQATRERAENGRKTFGERFVMPYYSSGSGKGGRSIARPLGTVTTRDRWAVVDGDNMRMLQPDEYRAAMSFPKTYKMPTTRANAIHLLGNAVCPMVARDILNELRAVA